MTFIINKILGFVALIGGLLGGFLYLKDKNQEEEIKNKNAKIDDLKANVQVKEDQVKNVTKIKNFESAVLDKQNTATNGDSQNIKKVLDDSSSEKPVKLEL